MREEIDNLFVDFDEMGFCPTTLCEDAEKYAIQWRNDMRNAIVKHETDLIKEFIEWLKAKYKGKFDKQAETYQYFCEDGFSMQDCEYHRGKLNEIEDLADELNQDLKKFLEERK